MVETGEVEQKLESWIPWGDWGCVTDIGTRYLFISILVSTWGYASTYGRNKKKQNQNKWEQIKANKKN